MRIHPFSAIRPPRAPGRRCFGSVVLPLAALAAGWFVAPHRISAQDDAGGALPASSLAARLFAEAADLPRYEAGEALTVDQAQAVRVRWQDLLPANALVEKVDSPDSFGADSRLLARTELARLLRDDIRAGEAEPLRAGEEGFFNLWTVDERRWDEARTLVALAFSVETAGAASPTLAIGCDYGFAVFVNGRAVYARVGYQPYSAASDLVPLPVRPGANEVVIAFQQRQKKKFRSYFANQWIAQVKLFPAATQAREEAILWNRHPLVTPLVHRLEGAVLRIGRPFFSSVVLTDKRGEVVARGNVADERGSIAWDSAGPERPFAGLLVVDDRVAEPVLIQDRAEPLERSLARLRESDAHDADAEAWAFRVRHLIDPQFSGQRPSLMWKHKLATAVAGAQSPRLLAGSAARGRGQLQLGSYTARLDGSRQHYLYYLPPPRSSAPAEARPVVVFVPTVSDPVRPFLESTTLAGQQEHEIWCSLADKFGCALLFPGYNDVDYGGELSADMLAENIRAFRAAAGPQAGDVFLFGVCSSGVLATRFAIRRPENLAGLALYSPVLHRRASRYAPGVVTELRPAEPATPEDLFGPTELARQLRLPCAILYDSDMPGHGDEMATDEFEREARAHGLDVTRFRCKPSNEYVWGERMAYRLGMFFEWIQRQSRDRRSLPSPAAPPAAPVAPATIASALRAGFHVAPASERLSEWKDAWAASHGTWHGADLPVQPPSASAIPVVFETWELSDIASHFPELGAEIAGEFFGALLVEKDPRRVVVFATRGAAPPLPRFDPLLDAQRSRVLFRREKTSWNFVESMR